MRNYTTEGIVLKRMNFGEADRILTIFTKHLGKAQVLAKGVRKPTSRKGGNLELFNWVRIFVAQGKSLGIVTEVETIKSFKNWRKDLQKVALAYYFSESVEKLTAEHVPSREIFSLLTETFENLAMIENNKQEFERQLLELTGFWPKGRSVDNVNLKSYIEEMTQRRMNSKKIFSDLIS